ncbi:hypothetical protein RvY_18904 [Ramazzottius varieornatus]|uniref:Cilia-and flagella-associated protein 96 n=1 Tax=Ramazzottius varieornatus TaxID=947166 RepID=A0A1D1WBW5_RAMVA|nr:hypothetical protein RvY_18904 [Ramazzottius varieornatus]
MVGMRAPIPWIDLETASKLRPEAEKGKQMLGRGPKKMMAKRDWAFDKEERRIFEGDGTFDPVRARHKRNMEQRQKDIGGRWAPPQGRILTNGKNTFYGTFAGRVDAFSAELKGRGPKDHYHPDFVAGAPKFGSYGWNNYTLSKYPIHEEDPYDGPPITKDTVDDETETENSRRLRRKPYKTFGKQGVLYFDKNPWRVANPPTEPPEAPSKPTPTFKNPAAFRPPGRPKPVRVDRLDFESILD